MICSDIIPDYIWEDIPDDDSDNDASGSYGMVVMMISMVMWYLW